MVLKDKKVNGKRMQASLSLLELPEYLRAVAWEEGMRDKAEREIARNVAHVPAGVKFFLDGLDLDERALAVVSLWDGQAIGTNVKTEQPHGIRSYMESICALPAQGDDIRKWWVSQFCGERPHDERVNFSSLRPGFYCDDTESGALLEGVLRCALERLGKDAPDPAEVLAEISKLKAVIPIDENGSVNLTTVARVMSMIGWAKSCVSGTALEGCDVVDFLVSIDGADAAIGDRVKVDMGLVTADLAEMRKIVDRFGYENLASCSGCLVWFVSGGRFVGSKTCMLCGRGSTIFSGVSVKDRLIEVVRAEHDDRNDLALNFAWATGLSLRDARRLLVESDAVASALWMETQGRDSSAATCPVARECDTVCGKAQRDGVRALPLTESGEYEECPYYRYLDVVKDVDSWSVREQLNARMASELRAVQQRRRKLALSCLTDGDSGGYADGNGAEETNAAEPDASKAAVSKPAVAAEPVMAEGFQVSLFG